MDSNKIDEFVDTMLKDDASNIKIIPDALEKIIYKSVITKTLTLATNALNSIEIKILGQKFRVKLEPVIEEEKL